MCMARMLTLVAVLAAALFVTTAPAQAVGGNFVIKGGTEKQHVQVRAAPAASSFNWSVVRARVVIHIVAGSRTHARRGHIMLSSVRILNLRQGNLRGPALRSLSLVQLLELLGVAQRLLDRKRLVRSHRHPRLLRSGRQNP